MMRGTLACAVAALTATAALGQLPPEKTIASMKVSDGLEITLWAHEPLCVNPTCCDVDHKGRVWISESINYRTKLRNTKPRRPEGDRIVILEDSTGKGQADKATVFYQHPDILSPLGIAVVPYPDGVGQKVYVCQSPDILVFEDKDGDLKADGPPTKLLTGFRGVDHDHGVHGILVGPDNKLYFTVGDSGVGNLKASDGKGPTYNSNGTDCRAATVWRCDLDGKNLQLIAHNFRNNYEPCVDSFGTVYLSDNDDDGNQQTRICYVMKGGDYGYHRNPKTSHWNEEHPGIVPKILRTYFGSPTGICVYEGDLLPKEYRGNLLHTDAGPRHVRCYHLTPKGAAYAVDREDMVQSSDNWFRPSDVCVAPDGSLIVSDWYDPGVGGHGVGDLVKGRIFRIAPKGAGPMRAPPIDVASREGVVRALASPNLAVRAMAMAAIPKNKSKFMGAIVTESLPGNPNRILRARALWQASMLGAGPPLDQALCDADPDFRILAMRIIHDFRLRTNQLELLASAIDAPSSASSAVRREALLQLAEVDPAQARDLIYKAAAHYDGNDRFYLAAVGIAFNHHDAKRRETLFGGFEKAFPTWNAGLAGLLWELRPPQAAEMLTARLTDAKIPAVQRMQIVDVLAASDHAKAGAAVAAAFATETDAGVRERIALRLRENLSGKWRPLAGMKELHDAVRTQLKTSPGDALGLVAAGEMTDFAKETAALASDAKVSASLRHQAVRTLGSLKSADAQATLATLSADADAVLAAEAVHALGRQGTGAALKSLQSLAADTGRPQALRQAAVAGLALHKQWASGLLDDFAAKRLPADLTADLARLLRNSPYPDVKKRAEGTLPPPPKLDPKNLPSIPALLTRKGNALRGKDLFEATLKNDAACLKCHVVHGVGGKAGPELSVIGSKASRENLLESILYPSRAIADQFVTWVVEGADGKTVTGVVAEETPTHLILRDANVNEHRFEKAKIASKNRSPLSLMPDNLILHLPENDLIDVVEYLYSLRSPTLTPTGLTANDALTTDRTPKMKKKK